MFRFGIMGAGNIAAQFCDAVKISGCAEVIAVASRTPGKAEIFAKKNDIPFYYSSYEEMLAKKMSTVYMLQQRTIFTMKI